MLRNVQAKVTESRHCSYCECSHKPSVALRTPWQLCLLVPEVGCLRSPAGLPSVWRLFPVSDGACDTLPILLPIHGNPRVQVGWIWRPLVFGNEIWAVGSEPVLRDMSCVLVRRLAARCIHWATVECSCRQDWEGDGQCSMQNPLKWSRPLPPKHMPAETITCMSKLLTFSQKTSAFLLPTQTVIVVADRRV